MIGGGEMVNWHHDSSMYRGGGNSNDALRLLGQARSDVPDRFLRECWTVRAARDALLLEDGLTVPDGLGACVMKNFNNDATAGPFLRAFGIKRKHGLKGRIEEFVWRAYDRVASGEGGVKGLPYLTARVGFRTKLVTIEEALRKINSGGTFGRAVMMLDAVEQATSSPLYNILSRSTFQRRGDHRSGFRNGTVRASSDWMILWEEVRDAKVIVELDWSKFDRERPSEDLEFIIQVVISCFTAKSEREARLLASYEIMMRRALIERVLVTDEGGVFTIEGMVPSGSLWTGWIDTALNILYMKAACLEVGISSEMASPKCAGDDNLTLFKTDPGDRRLNQIREVLNKWFRAGIEDSEFMIRRPPYHVTKVQACFPPGMDLRHGTSRLRDQAKWVEFDDEIVVNEEEGRSHRWEYRFIGKPKFLSCYWLGDGRPIRPSADNLEKILWPEGIHNSLDDYIAAVMAMVVDNPWNHHNVNHMMTRYVIAKQVQRQCFLPNQHIDCIKLARARSEKGEPVPYPQIAGWRRQDEHIRMEEVPEVEGYMHDFRDFMTGVTTLYARKTEGGIDAWKFMDILRGEGTVGEGQFGNDLREWLNWMYGHPATKFLRKVRGYQDPSIPAVIPVTEESRAQEAIRILQEIGDGEKIGSSVDFGIWLSDIIRKQKL